MQRKKTGKRTRNKNVKPIIKQQNVEAYKLGMRLMHEYHEQAAGLTENAALSLLAKAKASFKQAGEENETTIAIAEAHFRQAQICEEQIKILTKINDSASEKKISKLYEEIQDCFESYQGYSEEKKYLQPTKEIDYKVFGDTIQWLIRLLALSKADSEKFDPAYNTDVVFAIFSILDHIQSNDARYFPILCLAANAIIDSIEDDSVNLSGNLTTITEACLRAVLFGNRESLSLLIGLYEKLDGNNEYKKQSQNIYNALRAIEKDLEGKEKGHLIDLELIRKLLISLNVYFKLKFSDTASNVQVNNMVCFELMTHINASELGHGYDIKYLSDLQNLINYFYKPYEIETVRLDKAKKELYLQVLSKKIEELKEFEQKKLNDALKEEKKPKNIGEKEQHKSAGARRKRHKPRKDRHYSLSLKGNHPVYEALKSQRTKTDELEEEQQSNSFYTSLADMQLNSLKVDLPTTITSVLNCFEHAFLVGSQARERICAQGRNSREIEVEMAKRDVDVVVLGEAPDKDYFDIVIQGHSHRFVRCKFENRHNLFQNRELKMDICFTGKVQSIEQSLVENAKIRDFTVNAFYIKADGSILRPSKRSVTDLYNLTIRLLGDPDVLFKHSPDCCLRYLTLLGMGYKGTIPPEQLKKYYQYTFSDPTKDVLEPHVDYLNRERLFSRLIKMLTKGYAANTLNAMREYEVIDHIFPGINENNINWLIAEFAKEDKLFEKHMYSKLNQGYEICRSTSQFRLFALFILARIKSDLDYGLDISKNNLSEHVERVIEDFNFPTTIKEKMSVNESLISLITSELNLKSVESNTNVYEKEMEKEIEKPSPTPINRKTKKNKKSPLLQHSFLMNNNTNAPADSLLPAQLNVQKSII